MWKFRNFSAIQNLCEINFSGSKSSKSAIFAILKPLNLKFGNFQPSKIAKIPQNQNSEALTNAKMADFEILETPILISCMILVVEKS